MGALWLPTIQTARAASPSIWNGGGTDNNWTTAANWGGNAPVPSTTYDLQFAGSTRLTPNNDFTAGSSFRNITFNAGAGQFVIGGNSILLRGSITNSSSVLQTINSALSLDGNATYDGGAAGLKLGGQFSQNASANVLTVTNSVEFSGGMAIRPPIANTGRIFTVNGTGTALFSGAVTDGGTTMPALSQVIYSGSGTLTLAATGNSYTGQTTVNSGTFNLSGTLTGGGAVVVQTTGSFVEGAAGGISGASALTFSSSGTSTLAGSNTYTGTTSLSAGTLNLNNAGALGSGRFTINGSTSTINNTGGAAVTDQTNSPAITLSSNFAFGGSNSLSLGAGAVSLTGDITMTLNGNNANTLTFGGTTTNTRTNVGVGIIANNASGVSGKSVIFNNLNLNNNTATAALNTDIGGSANITVNGVIANGNNFANTLSKQGTGTLLLTGTSTYTGVTAINAGTLQLGNGGTTGSLSATSNITDNGNLTINRSSAVTQGTDFGTITGGSGSLTQAGSGTTTLTATNNYIGATTVNGGTLGLTGASNGTTAVAVNNSGTLLLGANDRINNAATVTLNGGTINTGGFKEGNATGTAAATTGLGALTLSSSSTLDFGSGHAGSSVLAFAASNTQTWNGTLSLLDFTPNVDFLNFASSTGLTATQLSEISLSGFTATGLDAFGDVTFTVTAVPEPATWFGGSLLLTAFAARFRRSLRRVCVG